MLTMNWDALKEAEPINKTAANVVKKGEANETLQDKIRRLEKENLELQQEVDWYFAAEGQMLEMATFMAKEITRLANLLRNSNG